MPCAGSSDSLRRRFRLATAARSRQISLGPSRPISAPPPSDNFNHTTYTYDRPADSTIHTSLIKRADDSNGLMSLILTDAERPAFASSTPNAVLMSAANRASALVGPLESGARVLCRIVPPPALTASQRNGECSASSFSFASAAPLSAVPFTQPENAMMIGIRTGARYFIFLPNVEASRSH
jgi:hypothetical protein